MAGFGQAAWVGLDHVPEAGIPSYLAQVERGDRPDGHGERLRHLAQANFAHNYIHWARRRSNDAGWLATVAKMERRIRQPFGRVAPASERAAAYVERDYHVERQIVAHEPIARLRAALLAPQDYHDPYVQGFAHSGAPDTAHHPMLYMASQKLFEHPDFLTICANEQIVRFCQEVLGPKAALSWAWAWVSNPGFNDYQNQNWHRDSSEPFNFIRVFVPLQTIADELDGPTALIPGTSGYPAFCEVRRYSDEELAPLQAEKDAGLILADEGDVYFVNTFALHKGTAPLRRRAMLTLLVSIGPSHRTPAIGKLRRNQLSPAMREAAARHPAFFRHLVR